MKLPWLQWPLTACSFAALTLNGSLIPIILTRSSHVIGTYKNLLVAYTLVGFLTSLSICTTLPVLYPSSMGCIFHSTVVHFTPLIGRIFIPLYAAGFVLWTLVLTYSFLYRYLVVRGVSDLLFTRKRAMIFICATLSLIVGDTFELNYFPPEEEFLNAVNDKIKAVTGEDIYNLSHVGGMFYKPDGTFGRGLYHCGNYSLQVSPCLVIMAICTYRFNNLIKKSYFSEATRKTHRNLFTLLIIQTVIPAIFLYIPALADYSFAFLKYDLPDNVIFSISSLFPIAQLIDPILIFVFIKEYRTVLPCFRSKVKIQSIPIPISFSSNLKPTEAVQTNYE